MLWVCQAHEAGDCLHVIIAQFDIHQVDLAAKVEAPDLIASQPVPCLDQGKAVEAHPGFDVALARFCHARALWLAICLALA
ncbi:hypothetical protein CK227_10415 [Mesorhizobium sp. WSM4308]|nr:hypothetical protein CK227_10415 [Mesorhizobium sp. WSM4308]